MFQEGHNKYKVTFLYKSNDFLQQFLKRHIKKHMEIYSNSLGHRKYFSKLNLMVNKNELNSLRKNSMKRRMRSRLDTTNSRSSAKKKRISLPPPVSKMNANVLFLSNRLNSKTKELLTLPSS